MKRTFLGLFFLTLCLSLTLPAGTKGYLFIIGGGTRPEEMMKKFVELCGQSGKGKIIIFPMASSVPAEVGAEQAEELKKLGTDKIEYHIVTRDQALNPEKWHFLDDAGGVFFSGGDQSRLMDILLDTPLHKKLLQLYDQGCVIGGTSAGAAVMSEVMITGGEKREVEEGHEFETIGAGNIVTSPGLGFLKTAIIDQHFVTRKRHNRLISLVAENPNLLGLGIDESTAILVRPGEIFEVLGEKTVVVYDASRARIVISPSGLISFAGMEMSVLVPGDLFDLKQRKLVLR